MDYYEEMETERVIDSKTKTTYEQKCKARDWDEAPKLHKRREKKRILLDLVCVVECVQPGQQGRGS